MHGVSSEQSYTWPQILGSVTDGIDLTVDQARWAMDEVMTDSATSAQIAAFGVGVKMKGAAPAELAGLSQAMLDHATLVDTDRAAIDIVGTCLLYTSPSPRDQRGSRMPSSA